MGIEGLPPTSDSSYFNKIKEDSSTKASKAAKTGTNSSSSVSGSATPFSKILQVQKVQQEQQPQGKQHVSDEVSSGSNSNQARQAELQQEIVDLDQSIANSTEDLNKATQTMMTSSASNSSYWDQLNVTEKAQKINDLKDKISKMELQRSETATQLKQQVADGTYQISGQEILQGMMKELF